MNFARTAQYKNSAIPYIQRRLNEHAKHSAEAAARVSDRRRAEGRGQGPGGAAQARGPG